MRPRRDLVDPRQPFRIAARQLRAQVPPLVVELAARHADATAAARAVDLPRERVTASGRFLVHGAEVGRDGPERAGLRAEPAQLRMTAVTPRSPAQHGLGEQRFAPQSHQAAPVEVPRMQRPDPHAAVGRS
jgi:hypothetical protein